MPLLKLMSEPIFEVDFLPVGEGECSGDAIALRYQYPVNGVFQQFVAIIDGGTKDSGEQLVNHVNTHYKTNVVDVVISTHPDRDHSSGLSVVLEKMAVRELLMHQPWQYAEDIRDLFQSTRLTIARLETKMEESLRHAKELEDIAIRKGVRIIEPFAGVGIPGFMTVLGPTPELYQELLPHFRGTPEAKQAAPIFQQVQQSIETAMETVAEALHIETLTDASDHFSAENRTSVITLFNLGGKKVLFTGDADIEALTAAADYAQALGIPLNDLHLLHVPHHGSRHNVGPTILNRIRAEKAQISASKDSPKHPAKKVVNALTRRGSKVFATQGMKILHSNPPMARPEWGPVQPLPFYDRVEA